MIKRIHGFGPEVSPLMVVTDYPTKEDIETGKPLCGPSGALVQDYLKQNNYSLEKCYKTSYIKCQLVGYNSKAKKKAAEALAGVMEIDNWGQILIEEIKGISPNVILCLGELAFSFLTSEKNINRYRGSILPLAPKHRIEIGLTKHIRVVPSFHPRDIFPNPLAGVYVKLDFAKALKFINNTRELEEPGNLWIARNAEALQEYWKRAKNGEFIVTDIETKYNIPICASLCADGMEAVSFPLMDNTMTVMESACLWAKYAEILRSNMPKVNQNMCYDWTVLERFGFKINNIVGDTMLMAHTIYPELPKGLDFLTSIYTDMTYYKDEGKEYDAKLHDFERLLLYNAKDALATWKVWKLQQQDAEDLNVKKFYFNFVHRCFFHYKKINDRGIFIDNLQRYKLLEKYENLLEIHSSEINAFYGKELNVRSPAQVGAFVYEYLNAPLHTHLTPNGNEAYNTDEDTLTNLYLNEISDEIVKRILRQIILCRKIDGVLTLLETPFHCDHRMRTFYNLGGTTTGRTSTSQAIGWFLEINDKGKLKGCKLGTAFQKIPKHGFPFEDEIFGEDIRSMFVPSNGYAFFSFDGKNAEGRCVCVLAEDWETLDYIEAGNDIHKLTASWIYEKPIEYIKKHERDMGKRARHAGNLGQTGAGLSPQVYKSVKFCTEVMRKFHLKAPQVQDVFQKGIERLVENQRYLISTSGRRRDFFGFDRRKKHDTFKEAYSFIPQSTVSDHFKLISLDLAESSPWAFELMEAHDGLLYEIPKDRVNEFKDAVLKASARKIDFSGCSLSRNHKLHIPVEIEISETNWYELKEIEVEVNV